MNVLMVTSSYPKFPGDVTAPFIASIAESIAERGHQVDVLLPQHPELRLEGRGPVRLLPYEYAPFSSWHVWGYAQSLEADVRIRRGVYWLVPLVAAALRSRIGARLRDHHYDVVHAHWVVPNAAIVSDIVTAHRTPLVTSLHGSDVFLCERLDLLAVAARQIWRRSGAVTACSADLHRRALALGADSKRTHTIPYGVDVERFAPDPDPSAVRAQLGVADGRLFVLALGRLVEKKGFAHLVEAVRGMDDVHVAIAGAGDLAVSLQRLSTSIDARVHWLGRLDRDMTAAALGAADVVVVPSVIDSAGNVDGLPNTLLEALSAGRAVVASAVGGIPEIVRDGVNGLLVPPGDAPALRAALARLAAEPQTRLRLGAEARRTAVDRLTWSESARRFEECYAQAAALDAR